MLLLIIFLWFNEKYDYNYDEKLIDNKIIDVENEINFMYINAKFISDSKKLISQLFNFIDLNKFKNFEDIIKDENYFEK